MCVCARSQVCLCVYACVEKERNIHTLWLKCKKRPCFREHRLTHPRCPCGFASCNVRCRLPYGRGALPAQQDRVSRRGGGGGQEPGARAILWEQADVSLSFTESTPVFVYVSEISVECLQLAFVYVCGSKNRIWEWEVTGKECHWRVTSLSKCLWKCFVYVLQRCPHTYFTYMKTPKALTPWYTFT